MAENIRYELGLTLLEREVLRADDEKGEAVPNQVRCFAPTLAATAGWTSPACARSLPLTPGVFPRGPKRIMSGGSNPM